MGIGIVIFLHLIVIFFLSAIISLVVSLLTHFLSNKEKKKQKVFAALLSPFFGFYTLYFTGLVGSIVVSEMKNVDVGIGDSFYVPLIDKCEQHFIDVLDNAYIENNGQQVVRDISQIQQIDYQILGKTRDEEYLYDIKKNELTKFNGEKELSMENSNGKLKLEKVDNFYLKKRNEVAGFYLIVVGIISVIVSGTVVYMTIKLIVGYLNFR